MLLGMVCTMTHASKVLIGALSGLLGYWVLFPLMSRSQSVVPEAGSTGTQVRINGNIVEIEGGSLSRDQTNLFHSFEEFGLNQGQTANFQSPTSLQNMLIRVIGGKASLIDGELQLTGSNANLFFLNPSGVLFGPESRLNLPADFTATTASGIGFAEKWFDALGGNGYADLVGSPQFLGFTMVQPSAIANTGQLSVRPGQNLSLIGGQVLNTGDLTAPGGQVNLLSVPGNSQVQLDRSGALLNLAVKPLNGEPLPGMVPMLTLPELLIDAGVEQATGIRVYSDGTVQLTSTGPRVPDEAGTTIASGRIDVSDAGMGAVGGEVNVLGDRVAVLGVTIDASGEAGGGTVRVGGDFQGQEPTLAATQTFVDQDSVIRADALGSGNGGNIFVWADGTTRFYGLASAQGRGGMAGGASSAFLPKGGFVEISGRESLAFDGYVDVSAVSGEAGQILFDPRNITIVSTAGADDSFLTNNSGQVLFEDSPSDNFEISRTAIESSVGTITLQAIENITFDSRIRLQNRNTDFVIEAGENIIINSGNDIENFSGGDIRFNAGNNIIGDSMRISTNGGDIFLKAGRDIQLTNSLVQTSNKTGTNQTLGNSGNVFVEAIRDIDIININTQIFTIPPNGIPANAGSVSIVSEEGRVRTAPNTAVAEGTDIGGNGGDIFIQALGDVTTTTLGSSAEAGRAGSIFVESLQGSITDSSLSSGSYSADSKSGNGGDITLLAKSSIFTPFITSGVGSGLGNAGNVVIEAGEDIVINRANSSNMSIATRSDLGNAGNITLTSREGAIDTTIGTINSSSQAGNGGNVVLSSARGIRLNSIAASTGAPQGVGGDIEANSGEFFKAIGTLSSIYPNSSCNGTSICSAGGTQNRSISIAHRGGKSTIPFVIGNASVNGTSGSITTGIDTLSSGSFVGSFSLGDIRLITQDQPLAAADSYALPDSRFLLVSAANGVLKNDTPRNGLPLKAQLIASPQNGVFNLNEDGSFTYIPKQGFTGTDSFSYIATDNILDSSVAVATINLDSAPEAIPLPQLQTPLKLLEDPTQDPRFISSLSLTGPELFLGAVEKKQTIEIEKGLNVKCRPPKDLFTIQKELRQVERTTNTRNAVIYVDFFPSKQSESLEKIDKDNRDVWDKLGESRTAANLSDDDQLVIALVTANGLRVVHHLDREGQNVLSEWVKVRSSSESLSQYDRNILDRIEILKQEQRVPSPSLSFDGETTVLNFLDSASIAEYGILDVDDSGIPSGINFSYENSTLIQRINITGSWKGSLGQISLIKDALSLTDAQESRSALLGPSKILYNWLIKPIENDLKKADVQNLSFVMGKGLRSLPIALLYDGQKFLVEKYSVGIIPSFSCIDPTYRNLAQPGVKMLAMGASRFNEDFLAPLGADKEIKTLEKIWKTGRFLPNTEDFTTDELKPASRKDTSIIHLVTHGAFGGDPKNSYLYIKKGKDSRIERLTMEDFKDLELDSPPPSPVELLVLSACSTAEGEEPELSLAGAAVQAKVKSVIATLDEVSYSETAKLTTIFYQELVKAREQDKPIIKARALQQAQIKIMNEQKNIHPSTWALITIVGSPW